MLVYFFLYPALILEGRPFLILDEELVFFFSLLKGLERPVVLLGNVLPFQLRLPVFLLHLLKLLAAGGLPQLSLGLQGFVLVVKRLFFLRNILQHFFQLFYLAVLCSLCFFQLKLDVLELVDLVPPSLGLFLSLPDGLAVPLVLLLKGSHLQPQFLELIIPVLIFSCLGLEPLGSEVGNLKGPVGDALVDKFLALAADIGMHAKGFPVLFLELFLAMSAFLLPIKGREPVHY